VREFFDHQAATFERRAGLPEEYCREIALAVLETGEAGANDLVVELGAGTGQIGRWFSERVRYVGLDLSRAMLREFRARLDEDAKACMLVRADAQARWPVADASARIVFASRAIHLLDEEHVAREMLRVAAPDGAMLIIGRVRRDAQSMRAVMAREMNRRLLRRGYEGRGGEKQNRKLFEACRRLGAEILEPKRVARWTVSASPRASLDSWRSLVSLGGRSVPDTIREEILNELESWAEGEFGSLDREFQEEESYTLYAVALSFR
jgi:ubiquinone/menaquinone biosynthesis C-methylase UbiE